MSTKLMTIVFVGLITYFCSARLWGLTSAPPGLFVDESSIGYNAWTILKTGKDEHGISFPIYFQAFGDYKNPLFVYSVALVFSILGPSILALRLTAALWGLAALLVFFSLLKTARVKGTAFLLIVLIVVTNPWFFQLSRVAFEVASTPFFLLLAIHAYFVLTYRDTLTQKSKYLWLCVFSLALAGTFYSYTSGRLLAPALLVTGLVLLYKKIPNWQLCMAGIVCLLCVMPALNWDASHPGALLARYQVVGLSNYTKGPVDFLTQASINYFGHFSPQFLLFGGDGNLRHIPTPFGVVFISSVPFAIVGLYSLLTQKRTRFSYWILFGLFFSPIPSALTIQSPHVLRSVGLLVFLCILFWYGVVFLFSRSKAYFWLIAWGLTLVIESCLFANTYFTSYAQRADIWFDSRTVEMINSGTRYPGPFFLSSQLYPGTEATVEFLRIVHTPSLNLPLEKTTVFDPETFFPDRRGVYFFDNETCKTLPETFLDSSSLVHYFSGNCVYIRKV